MDFWTQHDAAETKHVERARLPQNAPTECAFCGHFGTDVLLAVCAACAPPTRSGEAS